MSALLRGIKSKHDGDFHCLNCFHSYSTEKKLKKHEKVCYDHDYRYVEIPNEENKILKYNHGEKSMKPPLIIHADLVCLLEKMHSCQNNPEKSYTEKKNLTQQKTTLIVIGEKIVWKSFVKIQESMRQK